MEERMPLSGEGGELFLRLAGERAAITARRRDDRRGLYKCWLSGPDGREKLLGTFLPEGGELRLRRDLSRRTLEEWGVWPVAGGRSALAFPFQGGQSSARGAPPAGWFWERDPGARMGDPLLRAGARALPGPCLRRAGEEVVLAFPFSVKKPFPLPPAFCLMRVFCLEGRLWVILRLDGRGWPLPPPEEGAFTGPSGPSGPGSPPGRPPGPGPAPPASPGRRGSPG